jgi:hypothetical protein
VCRSCGQIQKGSRSESALQAIMSGSKSALCF